MPYTTVKSISGRRLSLNSREIISSGSDSLLRLLSRVAEAFKPYRDDVVLDDFTDYLEQRSWTDATGYAFQLREHPVYSSNRGKIEAVMERIISAISPDPREVLLFTHSTSEGHKVFEVAVITDVISIGD